MADEQDSDDGDDIKLSASALVALHEFYAECSMVQGIDSQQDSSPSQAVMPTEDWVHHTLWAGK